MGEGAWHAQGYTGPFPIVSNAMDLTERVVTLEAKLDHVLPTLVTKADLHEALHAQTWKIVGTALAAAGLIVASLKLLH